MAVLLGSLICNGENVVYMDETSVSSQDVGRRSWATRVDPNIHFKDNRDLGTTIFGAISPLFKPVYMLASSTNHVDYFKFIRLVVARIPANVSKPLLYFDGHAAHTRS